MVYFKTIYSKCQTLKITLKIAITIVKKPFHDVFIKEFFVKTSLKLL